MKTIEVNLDYVIMKLEDTNKSKGGIIVPEGADDGKVSIKGTVVFAGKGYYAGPVFIENPYKVGDVLIITANQIRALSGVEWEDENGERIKLGCCRASNILGKIVEIEEDEETLN